MPIMPIMMPFVKTTDDRRPTTDDHARSAHRPTTEIIRNPSTSLSSFRNLYTRILLGLEAQQHPILGITSAIAGEGKTTIASGLVAALAEDGALSGMRNVEFGMRNKDDSSQASVRSKSDSDTVPNPELSPKGTPYIPHSDEPDTTLLIECNPGAPPEDPRLALRPGPGLIQLLRGECDIEAAIQESDVERLSILPLGEPAHSFPLAIRTAILPDVIAELRSRYGLIVLDLPSVLNSTDTQVLARLADQLILVVRAEVTPAKLVRQALDQLGEGVVLGIVLNDSRPDLPSWLDQRL